MPTDGADFRRRKTCYGRAYSAIRDGASNEQVAVSVVSGLEVDIRREGGLPAFNIAIETLVTAQSAEQVHEAMDGLRAAFADSSLSREVAAGVERLLPQCVRGGISSTSSASVLLLTEIARGRACDGMSAYLARNSMLSMPACLARVDGVVSAVGNSAEIRDLGQRMLNASEKGMPAKAPKLAPVKYEAAELHGEVIG